MLLTNVGAAHSVRGPRTVLTCMYALRSISWENTGCEPNEHGSDSPHDRMITLALGWLQGKFHANNMVIYRLWERHNYYYAFEHFDEIYQRHLPAHTTMEAKQIAFDEHAREINEAQVREGSEITSLAIIKEALQQILKRGLRWTALVTAFESEEILLLDQDAPLFENSTLGDVLLDCSDNDFEWMKGFLLLPENGLKNTCFRLSGISNMLKDLSDTGHDSPVRPYLETEVKRRIENAIPQADSAPDFSSERVFESLRDRAIVDIFGIRSRMMNGPLPDDFPIQQLQTTDPMGKQIWESPNISCN
jgi:hypothetical protein